jgi:hypothetical protein
MRGIAMQIARVLDVDFDHVELCCASSTRAIAGDL